MDARNGCSGDLDEISDAESVASDRSDRSDRSADDEISDMHAAVQDINSDSVSLYRGRVRDLGTMRDLIGAYTFAEIERAIYGFDLDVSEQGRQHEKLTAMWGGDPQASLFSPMDALAYPCYNPDNRRDEAIAAVILGLPPVAAPLGHGGALMYAIQGHHGPETIRALCSRGACFAQTERSAAIVALLREADAPSMEAVLSGLSANGNAEFITAGVSDGNALHLCCRIVSVDSSLYDRVESLQSHGVDPRARTAEGQRPADILAVRAMGMMKGSEGRNELVRCIRFLDNLHSDQLNLPRDAVGRINDFI
jgi:hypothetical protein